MIKHPTHWDKVFTIKNFIKYKWWRRKNRFFWYFSARSTPPLKEVLEINRGQRKKPRLRYRLCQKIVNFARTHLPTRENKFYPLSDK